MSAVTERLSQQVYEHARSGKFVLTLGGDHSIAIGTISGTAKAVRERLGGREIAVIWVDAHGDINTPETSDSGNIHGMPLAFLTGLAKEEKKDMFGWLEKEHLINVRKLVYIGLRDVDRGEKKILRDNGIKAFSMHDIDRYVIIYIYFCLFVFPSTYRTSKLMILPYCPKDTELDELSRWPLRILAPTHQSIFRSMWMR